MKALARFTTREIVMVGKGKHPFDSLRLSDPEMASIVDRIEQNLSTNRDAATAFLRRVGVLPPIGPLEKQHS